MLFKHYTRRILKAKKRSRIVEFIKSGLLFTSVVFYARIVEIGDDIPSVLQDQ